mgnify:CR=1 FL=1
MTLNQLAASLYRLSVGGYFNHEKWTRDQLLDYLRHWFGKAEGIDRIAPNARGWKRWNMEIALPDGWWMMRIWQMPNGEMDYDIPETREQEARWFSKLAKANRVGMDGGGVKMAYFKQFYAARELAAHVTFDGVLYAACTACASVEPETRQKGVYAHCLGDEFGDGDCVLFNGATLPANEEEARALLEESADSSAECLDSIEFVR